MKVMCISRKGNNQSKICVDRQVEQVSQFSYRYLNIRGWILGPELEWQRCLCRKRNCLQVK